MKKLTLFALLVMLFSVTFVACKKDDNKSNGMQYSISGLLDHDISQNGIVTYYPIVNHISGPVESIQLSVEGVPAGIDAILTPASGTPKFQFALDLVQKKLVTPGKYPITVKSRTASGNTKNTTFNLTVVATCASTITGDYTWEGYSNGNLQWSEDVVMTVSEDVNYLVEIKNKSGVLQGTLHPNCADNKIKFESSFSFNGFFTTNPKYIEIEDLGIKHVFKGK